MRGKHVEQVFRELESEYAHFTKGLIEELTAIHNLIEYGADAHVAEFLDTPNMRALDKNLKGRGAEFREAFLDEWDVWIAESIEDDDDLDEALLDSMSVEDIAVELAEGYEGAEFTIDKKRFSKLLGRLAEEYYRYERESDKQRRQIRDLKRDLYHEHNKTLFEHIIGRR